MNAVLDSGWNLWRHGWGTMSWHICEAASDSEDEEIIDKKFHIN
jgi:hypothetical protein